MAMVGVIDAVGPDAGTKDSTTMGTGGVAEDTGSGSGCSMIGGRRGGAGVGVAVDAGAEASTTMGMNVVAGTSGSDPSWTMSGGGGGGAVVGVTGESGADDSTCVGSKGGGWTKGSGPSTGPVSMVGWPPETSMGAGPPTGATSVVLVGPDAGVVAEPDSTVGPGFNSSGQRPANSSNDIADRLGGTPRYDRPSKLIWVPIPAPWSIRAISATIRL